MPSSDAHCGFLLFRCSCSALEVNNLHTLAAVFRLPFFLLGRKSRQRLEFCKERGRSPAIVLFKSRHLGGCSLSVDRVGRLLNSALIRLLLIELRR